MKKASYSRSKAAILLIFCILFVSFSGCHFSKSDAPLDRQANELFQQLSADMDYGVASYSFLEFIQTHLDNRLAGSDQEKNMAKFIVQALQAMGYAQDQIKLQHFAFNQDPSLPLETPAPTESLLGYDQTDKSQNIILTIPGESDQTILVGAHYDSVDTHGVDDNGSGVSVLLESAFRLSKMNLPYTIQYIFFGAEETGMDGSQHYVKCLSPEETEKILYMVNVDSVLAGDYCYILGGISQYDGTTTQIDFLQRVYQLAQNFGLDVRLNETGSKFPIYTGTQKSDHYAFASIGIPYVYFWADNLETAQAQQTEKLGQIMHTQNDNLSVINDTFEGRAQKALSTYSKLLNAMLMRSTL